MRLRERKLGLAVGMVIVAAGLLPEVGAQSAPLPDLTVSASRTPTDPEGGAVVTFQATFSNRVSNSTSDPTDVVLLLDGVELLREDLPHLGQGDNVTFTATWAATLGDHVARWLVDPEDLVAEANETNNERAEAFDVGSLALDLAPDGPQAAYVLPTQSVAYEFELTNLGTQAFVAQLGRSAPPAGWSAVLSPASADLAPGETVQVVLTVRPDLLPLGGLSADIEVSAWVASRPDIRDAAPTQTTIGVELP